MLETLFNKVVGMKAATLLRRDSNTGVCEIFKNTFFHRTPTMAVSGLQKDFLTKKNHWKSFVLSSVYSKPILKVTAHSLQLF